MEDKEESSQSAITEHMKMQINRLKEEHTQLEQRLDRIKAKPLSETGNIERKILKKQKLAAKDKISHILETNAG